MYMSQFVFLITWSFLLTTSCADKTNSTYAADEDQIIGEWIVKNVEHVKEFDMEQDRTNVSFFGAEAWELSDGNFFNFKKDNRVETNMFEVQGEPIELNYQFDSEDELRIFLGEIDSEKFFLTEIKSLTHDKMVWLLDDYLKVSLVKE